MRAATTILKALGLVVVLTVGLLGLAMAAGYAFTDLPIRTAALLTLAWLLPSAALSVLALWAPDRAVAWLTGVTLAVVAFILLERWLRLVPKDFGPVVTVAVLALAVPLALMGLRHALAAGLLLLALGMLQLLGTVMVYVYRPGDGPPLGHLFTGSSGVIVLPLLLAGALFTTSGALTRSSKKSGWSHLPRTRHAH